MKNPRSALDKVSMERHGYSDRNPEIPFSEIKFKQDEEKLVEQLSSFLINKSKRSPDGGQTTPRKAREKANYIIQNRNKESRKGIKEAISYGYIWNIEIDKPWHPKFFFNFDGVKTYPFQHKEVILWTGQDKHVFFSDVGKIDLLEDRDYSQFRNSDSVFRQNGLSVGNRHDNKEEGTRAEAVYLSQYLDADVNIHDQTALHYAQKREKGLYQNGAIFEFRIPSQLLHLHNISEGRWSEDSIKRNIKELKENVSPVDILKGSRFEYQYRKDTLFLDLCTVIHEVEGQLDDVNFVGVERYHERIFEKHPFRVPWEVELTSSKLSQNKAQNLRVKKLKKWNFYELINYLEDLLKKAEDLTKLIGTSNPEMRKFVKRHEIPTVEQKGQSLPVQCDVCGDIFQGKLCSTDGQSIEKAKTNSFIPNRQVRKKEMRFKSFRAIFSEPLEWEKKIIDRWRQKGDTYSSDLFFIEKAVPEILREFEKFESNMINYCSGLIKLLSELESENRGIEESINRIKEDINRTSQDMDEIKSSYNF